MPGAWIAGGALVGAGSSIFSSILGKKGADKSADAIRYAADVASRTALDLDTKARADLAPFREQGVTAGKSLMDLLMGGQTMSDFLKSSDLFNFQSELGTRNINRDLSARGLYGSGAGLETLARFNAQLTAEEGQRTFDRLFNVNTLGANAAARMATNTTQTGNTLANMTTQAGTAQGGAIASGYNALAQGVQGVGQAVRGGVGDYIGYGNYQSLLEMLKNQGNQGQQYTPFSPGMGDALTNRGQGFGTFNYG